MDTFQCRACKGTGRHEADRDGRCILCEGTGRLETADSRQRRERDALWNLRELCTVHPDTIPTAAVLAILDAR